jgi:parvulin-like peptidyl-prolyl isomerase
MAKTSKKSKKVSLAAALKAAQKPEAPVSKMRSFFAQKKNVKKALIVLIVLFALYLLKDQMIVAVVNGQPVFRWTVIKKLEEQGGRQVVDTLVTEKLVRQALRDQNVQVSKEEVDAAITEIEARLAAQGMTLDQALAQEGLTRQKLEDDIMLQKSAEKLVADKVSVTEEEIDAYIAENKEFLPAELTGDALRAEVRTQLVANETNMAIQAWVQELTANAKVQYWKQYPTVF